MVFNLKTGIRCEKSEKFTEKDVNFTIKNGEFKFYRKRVNSTEKVQN